jgi:ketosteroid isomerase-like protein
MERRLSLAGYCAGDVGENVEPVRQPITVGTHTRRRLEERLGLRFPGLLALVARAITRLSPRSRLRQAFLRRYARMAIEAANRGDHDAGLMLYHPDVESTFPPELEALGAGSGTRGREERLRFQADWNAEWNGWRLELNEVIDCGDRVLLLGRVGGRGLKSGAVVDTPGAFLFTISEGRARREQLFFDHGEALKAAGLSA